MNDMLQRQRWFGTRHLHFLSAVGMSVLFTLTVCGTALGQEPAAQIEVSGKVTTPEGHPISGVAVRVRGSATSTATDAQGSYTISAPGDGVLTFNLIGFRGTAQGIAGRSEEHTSELQSRLHLVCRLLLEKKKNALHRLSVDFVSSLDSPVTLQHPA